jgi:hypothetical protein
MIPAIIPNDLIYNNKEQNVKSVATNQITS